MIDQIAIRRRAGFILVQPAEWSAMDRDERLELLEAGRVEFLSRGEVVPIREALESLRTVAA